MSVSDRRINMLKDANGESTVSSKLIAKRTYVEAKNCESVFLT